MKTLLRVARNTNTPLGVAKEAKAMRLECYMKASAFRRWPVV